MCSPSQRLQYRRLKKLVLNCFPRYSQILQFLQALCVLYPNNVHLEEIGRSVQKRPIYMIVLQELPKEPKAGMMLESGIHGREWITITTALYTVDEILNTPTLLQCMDFYIIPCLNPDGYEYTHTIHRLWRKNMNKNDSDETKYWGVDLNRNFPCAFGGTGSCHEPSSSKFRGKCCLSEPESSSLANIIGKYSQFIKLYISLHCYGCGIMYPWGYTCRSLEDEKDLYNCAKKAQLSMRLKFPESKFRVGQISKVKYIASGNTADYVRQAHNIKFIFVFELHREGVNGYDASTSRILPIAEEAFAGIARMIKYVANYIDAKENEKLSTKKESKESITTLT